MIAIISDVHANLAALQAVIADIERRKIDKIAVLGDVIGYGPDPAACLKLVRELKPMVVLMGNHEHSLLNGCPPNMHPRARASIEWTRDQLSPEDIAAFQSWPLQYDLEGTLAVHASPRNPVLEYIFPHEIRRPQIMRERFDRIPGRHCVVGHVHVPGVFTENMDFLSPSDLMGNLYLFGGEKAIINVGSVGQPRDHDPRSCYVTFDGEAVVFRRVEYDVRATQERILSIPALDPFLASRLEVGR